MSSFGYKPCEHAELQVFMSSASYLSVHIGLLGPRSIMTEASGSFIFKTYFHGRPAGGGRRCERRIKVLVATEKIGLKIDYE